jgi:flagellar biosynthesis anti-sigma factor FlgM
MIHLGKWEEPVKITDKPAPNLVKPETAKSSKTSSAASEFDPKIGGLKSNQETKNSAQVDLSERAQLMAKAKEIASNSTVDEAKVARLQKLIDEGKYKVDADKVADKLIDTHMEFPE